MSTIFKENFTASKGKQKPESFEGAPKDTLTCNVLGKPERCGLTSADTITQEEPLEINTTAMPESAKWWVEGKLLEGEEAIAEETTVLPTEPFKLKLEGKEVGSFTIVCKGIKIKHGRIEAPGARSEEAVVFEKCEVEGKPECIVANTESKHLNAQLEGVPSAIKLKFGTDEWQRNRGVPYHGTAACKVQGFYRANGTMDCNYNGVETESAEHSLEFTETSGSKSKSKRQATSKSLPDSR